MIAYAWSGLKSGQGSASKYSCSIPTERDDDDIGYVGSRRVAGASTPREACSEDERKVSKALAEQGEMIKKNVAKAKLIEELLQKE